MLSERVQRLKERALAGGAARGAPGYRAYARMLAATEYGAQTWGQRRAFMLKALAEVAPIAITEDERIVGEHLFCEATAELDSSPWWNEAAERQLDATDFDESTKQRIKDVLKTEQTQRSAPFATVDGRSDEAFAEGWQKGLYWAYGITQNHSVRDFAKVILIGFGGIRDEVRRCMRSCDITDPEFAHSMAFLRAAEAVCDAGIILGRRYADTARAMATQCDDPQRKQELSEIAQVCRQVPERGARTLREAVQALWFTHILTCAEDGINANSIGRLDQYLYPYYECDVNAGTLDYEGAVELMAELACKLYRDYDVQQICLAGQTPDGTDAANDMTYAVLDATERLGLIRCISVRLHSGSPRKLLLQSARMLLRGGGIPFFFLDEAIVPALESFGVRHEHALDYAPIGCVEITIPGKAAPHPVSGAINVAKCMELALFDGNDPRTGEQLGPRTGALEDHATFDDFVAAYKQQVEHAARLVVHCCNRGQLIQIEREPLPLYSTLTDNCIARGRDIHDGGALYNYHSIMVYGVPNVADSLLAVKKAIYEEGSVSAGQLLEALRTNFDGDEPLRQELLRLPKYGNDQAEVDGLAADVAAHFCDYLREFRAPFGGFYAAHLFTFVWHIDHGKHTGATPDGRRAGEPLAYSLSPQQGRDVTSLTAMMKSLARIPHCKAAGSSSAIIEIDPSNFHGEAGEKLMADIIRSGIDMGIGQMQFNVTSAERLLKAQQDPEHYGNVQVRVSGYSSKFSLLSREIQDHIIARTKHWG